MAGEKLNIEEVYRNLVHMRIKTNVRKAYIDYLSKKYLDKKDPSLLKKLFTITKSPYNNDFSMERLGELCMHDPEAATAYAWTVLKAPWPVAEPTIRQDKEFAMCYAQYVLKLSADKAKQWVAGA